MPDASTLPAWAADILKQFPVAALVVLVAWYAFRYARELQRDVAAQLGKQHADQLASKDAEIARIVKDRAAELRRLRAAWDAEREQLLARIADLKADRGRPPL